ncbi:MAG: hypothetical protein M3032_05960 [Verrucomicrobiota bacterium]|nr:hypothetical protein [Verrucomicrobiota bacterium]
MKFFPRTFTIVALAGIVLSSLAAQAQAASVTYTFEQFAAPTSLLTNVSPEVGASSFKATFISPGSSIANMGTAGAITGNVLLLAGNTLQVTLSAAVNSISVAFGGMGGNFSVAFNSAAGSSTATTSPVGAPGMKAGSLNFSSPTAFNSFTLTSTKTSWAIDNLILELAPSTPGIVRAPEGGSSLLLLAFAGGAIAFVRRRLATV